MRLPFFFFRPLNLFSRRRVGPQANLMVRLLLRRSTYPEVR